MHKKLLSLALALAMCMSLCVPAFALNSSDSKSHDSYVSPENNSQEKTDTEVAEEFIAEHEVAHEITFPADEMPENRTNALTIDSPQYNGSYNQDYDSGVAVSPKYRESTYLLSQEAWQVFYGAASFNKFDKINIYSLKTFWR
ncbi:hypothetical protein [Oscillibacter sp.]|uniref:hypothetical protein n=1 Tax=Oscillibacter sp. TaxID=1945593 RepID=UPI0028AA7365|nr:hypothetical protein [Oscillibacter sp.]